MDTVREVLEISKRFVEPALKSSNYNADQPTEAIIQQLFLRLPEEKQKAGADSQIKAVLSYTLELLLAISHAAEKDAEAIWEPASVGLLTNLMDLIMLEGFLPFLSPGVALPDKHRPKTQLACEQPTHEAVPLDALVQMAAQMIPLVSDRKRAVTAIVRDRYLPDIVAILAELSYGPMSPENEKPKWRGHLQRILSETPSPQLLPVLSLMLTPATPSWLRGQLSTQLSLIPLRPHGVRHTIDFLAASSSQSPTPRAEGPAEPSQGPLIPVQALTQASMLLSRVPSAMNENEYFSRLSTQLWDLLDGQGGRDMSKASGHIISSILSRKSTGAPGSAGWTIFAAPLLSCIDPSSSTVASAHANDQPRNRVVSESALRESLVRLAVILQSQPNAGVAGRLIAPLVMPLWALAAFAYGRSRDGSGFWVQSSMTLLRILFHLTTKARTYLTMIVNQILFDGGDGYTFAPGEGGGIEIRTRDPRQDLTDGSVRLVESLDRVSSRVKLFMLLIDTKEVQVSDLIDFVLDLSRQWLLREQDGSQHMANGGSAGDGIQRIAAAILVPQLLEKYKDDFAQNPTKVLELGQQLLEEFVTSSEKRSMSEKRKRLDLQSLQRITSGDSEREVDEHADHGELLTLAISLFSFIVSSPGFKPDDSTKSLCSNVRGLLERISTLPSVTGDLRQDVNRLLLLLTTSSTESKAPDESRLLRDRETLEDCQNAASNSEKPPYERIEALKSINALIASRSAAIDTPSLTLLLLHIVQNESDEAVYLAGIESLVRLASGHNRIVTQLTLDLFVDTDEKSVALASTDSAPLDARLRVGEALSQISESLTDVGGVITCMIAEGVVKVASRRGQRPKDLAQRQKRKRVADAEKRKAEREGAFSLTFPTASDPASSQDDTELEGIVQGWENTGLEEDVRIRASALSIATQLLRHRVDVLPPNTVELMVDLILSVISLEVAPEKAILRRAAVLAVMALVEAASANHDSNMILSPSKWDEVGKVVAWASEMDGDFVVKGHAKEVQDAMENWRVSIFLGQSGNGNDLSTPRLGLEGQLKGLKVGVQSEASGTGKRAIIEELD